MCAGNTFANIIDQIGGKMKQLLNIVAKKAFISSVLFIFEIVTLFIVMIFLEKTFITFWSVIYILNLLTIFAIVNSKKLNNAFKISWIFISYLLPGVGAILFFIFGNKQTNRKLKKKFEDKNHKSTTSLNFENLLSNLEINPNCLQMMQWILNVTGQPTYGNTETRFLNSGETYFKSLIFDLKNAKKSIYLEFFIINPGYMWNEIVNILIEKANQNLDIRLIYDDFGTLTTLPKKYDSYLNKLKIKTQVFNRIKLRINSFMNNRDHRKIVIVDNKISYTGGINIADEYINKVSRFGYWQDSAVRIEGCATESFTKLFLNMWKHLSNEPINENKLKQPAILSLKNGLVLPFGDSPINKNRLNSTIYLKIITSAKKYVYIQTPYLIMDEQLTNAIVCAAQSSVKMIIVTPHIFDRFYVHAITQESYSKLIKAGVEIFEYTPGFLHSKMIISDDEVAILGTANFDYRSLYMQFENSVWMYKTKAIVEMIANFKDILQKSQKISIQNCENVKLSRKFLNAFIKPFITFF